MTHINILLLQSKIARIEITMTEHTECTERINNKIVEKITYKKHTNPSE